MRVTQGMLSNNMLRNLMNSQSQMDKLLTQVYSGKKINRPSDDPVIAMKGMNYRAQLIEVEQFKRNTGEANNWMDNSDAALDKATSVMQRLGELAILAGNATYGSAEHTSIKQEVEQLKEHMIDLANTNVNGKYIFNGTDTDTKPAFFDEDDNFKTSESESAVMIEVANGTRLQVNVNATKVFDEDLFEAIDDFTTLLTSGADGEKISVDDSITALDTGMNKIINARADLGARMNRLELVEDRLEELEVIATKTMSDNENVHAEEAITNLITQETLHRAALAAGSRIIQPSLIDFLR